MMGMMKYTIFTLVSYVEYLAIFALMFSAFKINYRWYKAEIIFVCATLTCVSLVMRENALTMYTSLVQLLLWIIYSWLLFRFSLLHAAIVTVCSYLAYGLIQSGVAIIALQFVADLEPMTLRTHTVALLSGWIAFSIAYWIYRRNWGFSFVPVEREAYMNDDKRSNVLFIFAIVSSIISIFVVYIVLVVYGDTQRFLIMMVTILLCLSVLIYLAAKMEIRKYAKRKEFK